MASLSEGIALFEKATETQDVIESLKIHAEVRLTPIEHVTTNFSTGRAEDSRSSGAREVGKHLTRTSERVRRTRWVVIRMECVYFHADACALRSEDVVQEDRSV